MVSSTYGTRVPFPFVLVCLAAACGPEIDFDRDGDEIQNGLDACPDEPGVTEFGGCPSAPTPPPPTPFSGTWSGTATFAVGDEPPIKVPRYTVGRTVATGPEFTLCGEALLFVRATVSSEGLMWQEAGGTARCPTVYLNGAVCVQPVFHQATARRLAADAALEVRGSGVMGSCGSGESRPFTYVFTGSRLQ